MFAMTLRGWISRGSFPLKLRKNPKGHDFAVSFGFWWKMWKQYRTRCLLLAEFRSYWRLSLSEFLACRVCLSKVSIQLCIMTRRDTLSQYRNRRILSIKIRKYRYHAALSRRRTAPPLSKASNKVSEALRLRLPWIAIGTLRKSAAKFLPKFRHRF